MPAKKERFDDEALLDGVEPTTPLPIEQRVQSTPVRPYLNTRYLAARVAGAELDRVATTSFPPAVFLCPVCGGRARAEWGTTLEGPFKLTCSGPCNPAALRNSLHDLAPAAFEPRDDILYTFSAEVEERVVRAVLDGDTTKLDRDARRAVRRFREMGGDRRHFPFKGPCGGTLMIVFRRDLGLDKSFLPVRVTIDPSDREDVEFTFPKGLFPLLGWDDLLARPDAPVLVVEGESTTLSARKLFPDHVVITSACGSSNARLSDWSPLHDRDVTVWPDNDAAGTKYARAVAAHAFAVRAKSIRIVLLPPGLSDGWDLANSLPDGLLVDDVRERVRQAPAVAWDDVKDALARSDSIRRRPPFRLPDGLFAADKIMVEAIEKATEHLDAGCKRGAWLAMLGAIHHAVGEAGFEIADTWSSRNADKHGKYHDGEVRRTLDVEEKYKAQWQIPNRLFVAVTANKREAVRVTEYSRRFAVYEVEDRFGGNQARREDFFGRMHAELENGGYEALAYDLLHTDLDGFSPAAVPRTKLFQELAGVDADRDPLRGWWRETLETGVLAESQSRDAAWTDPVGKDSLYMRYQGWCERDGPRSRTATLSKAEWAKQLGKMLPAGLTGRRQMSGGVRVQCFALPPYEDCCLHFERMFGTSVDRAPQPGQLRSVM